MKSETTMSSMSQDSQDSGNYRKHVCYCGIESPMITSWSDLNPGRRFFGCRNFRKSNAYNFFIWFDPPMQPRATSIILGLLRKLDRIEREKERTMERELEREMERVRAREGTRNDTWNILLFILVFIVVVGFGTMMV